CYKLRITPKRKDISLVDGEIWVDKGSFLIPRIEGEMSKTPSWWLKRVHLVLDFGNLGGTWQQTGTQALADVRMLGKRSLVSKVLDRSEEHTSELQSLAYLVCRLLLEKKKTPTLSPHRHP